MLIYEASEKITPAVDKTNIIHRFTVPQGIKRITVDYSYSPKTVEDKDAAKKAIGSAMQRYNITHTDPDTFMPVKNLITLSFDENGKYRGACHRQSNEQRIVIADSDSTAGIFNRSIEAGEWDIQLNAHYIGTEVSYSIRIEGEVE